MPKDIKYGQITTEYGDIPDDEPVMLFRGRDAHLVALIEYYEQLCIRGGEGAVTEPSPRHHLQAIRLNLERVREFQRNHPERVKVPNSNRYMQRTGGHELGE